MELPSHPESEDTTPHRPPRDKNRAGSILLVALGAVLLLIVILHLAGVVGPAR
jgi:hypothetical protein